jgi:hypothetical protein
MIDMETLNDIFNANGDKYRALMADLEGFDASHKDDVIKILLTISELFVDNAFGLGAVDLAIKARDKLSSQESMGYDTISALSLHEPALPIEPKDSIGGQHLNTKEPTPKDYTR